MRYIGLALFLACFWTLIVYAFLRSAGIAACVFVTAFIVGILGLCMVGAGNLADR